MRHGWLRALGAAWIAWAGASLVDAADGPLGFAPASRAGQAAAEAHALAVPTPAMARAHLRSLTEENHIAGTPADYRTAVEVRDKLRSWGWDADLAEYEVLLNYPVADSVRLELTLPTRQALKVIEDPNPADKDSTSPDNVPAFHGYGVSGSAAGQVVYANYGRPEDFEALETLGVDVRDKVVLVRYGGLFRGLKVLYAQKRGAKGVLIYSDPADDGYARGDVYPDGPFRPGSAIQRGSVQFLSLGPGDPSTPDGPSVKGAKRLPIDVRNGFPLGEQAEAWEKATGQSREDYFATIPSLPIGYDAARPILEAMGGPNVPSGWQGGLPLAYHVGPGPAAVSFSVEMDYAIRPVWNVIATIRGSAEPDRWVMIGNHRDAWTYGAVDPSSGTAATLETCRAIGSAVKQGWKPRRSIIYASWDAEEYGLVGSTEWADEHRDEVSRKALLMINVDSAVSGKTLDIDGVPSLRDLVLDALGAVTDPRSGKSLREVWVSARRSSWAKDEPLDLDDAWEEDAATAPRAGRPFSPTMNPLGSGSDYTAFLDHLGVPSVDINFGGSYGVYHSIYDDFYWMEKFCDPEFLTHATAARLYTVLAMRAAAAEVAPLTFTPYAEALRDYVDDLRRTVARKARAAAPGAKPPIAFEGLPGLIASVSNFAGRAEALDRAAAALAGRDGVPADRLERVNAAIARVERAFLLPSGLPGRAWFRHSIYAPGLTTGYASWPLPGVRQAILQDDPALLAAQLPALIARIDAAAEALHAATEAASAGDPPAGETGR